MKYLVAYMSVSGNTQKIAEAIHKELPEDSEIKPINELDSLEGFDFYFIGFPVHQYGAPKVVQEFMTKHAKGKKVALFVTHATGSQMEILEGQLNKCKEVAKEAELLGLYNCQGELSEQITNHMKNHENPQLRKFADMRKFTVGRPNEEEINMAGEFAKKIISKLK
ncbi:MAG: flavodoxin [Asgard group archaeon]|nr:flavodoxin [Asgard group archaeon]